MNLKKFKPHPMKTLVDYINERLIDQLNEQLILERNEKIFPRKNERSKMEIWTGDHCRQRQEERGVTDNQIVSSLFAAYAELNAKFKEREFEADRDPKKSRDILVIDARKDKMNPLTVSCWLYRNNSSSRLQYPAFTVKTVYYGTGGAMKSEEKALKVFLY